jgi:retinol dehydrogenase-14
MKKFALITGATSGLGKDAAEALAQKGFHVLIAGRDAERGAQVVQSIKNNGGDAEFLSADLFSKKGIITLANAVKQRTSSLSLLINNAGGTFPEKIANDGIERTFALNTVAPFLLSQALTNELSAAKGRIVNVATGVPKKTKVELETVANPTQYSAMGAYSNAKLSLIGLSIEQAQRLADKQISVVSIHPGIILGTRFGKGVIPGFAVALMRLIGPLFRISSPPEKAVARFLRASLDEVQSGTFFDQDKIGEAPRQAQDPTFRIQLWNLLENL